MKKAAALQPGNDSHLHRINTVIVSQGNGDNNMGQSYFNVDYEITEEKLRERILNLSTYLDHIENGIRAFRQEWEYCAYDSIDFEYKRKAKIPCFLYYILNKERTMVKIGISNDPIGRAKDMQTSTGYELEILKTIEFPTRKEALEAEKMLHDLFSRWRRRPSKVAKSSEWFDSCIVPKLMAEITTKEDIERVMKNKEAKELEEQRKAIEIMSKVYFQE